VNENKGGHVSLNAVGLAATGRGAPVRLTI
jgi:hypothetical protein